ncbi:putative uncharacterized protein DDB_G0282499 [Stegodyphus dumicola]|uniref:putative uncharacterized protein DDB_G0282499 n=1 Tax=Stegodyphus dumicola TaxID=202533 RepID=UPI0015B00564|nr:putative uncharacterized protein DDB_G0282499 [Stegodyphus dumicola]
MDSKNTSLREPVCIDDEVFFGPIGETEIKVKGSFAENLCDSSTNILKKNFVEEKNDVSDDEYQKHETSSLYNSFSMENSKYESFEDSLDQRYCASGLSERLNDSIRLAHSRQRMKNTVLYDSLEDICSLASNIDRGSISADIENVTNLLEKQFISEDSLRNVPENILNKESNPNEHLHFDEDSLAIFEHEKTFDDSLEEFSEVQKLHISESMECVEKQSIFVQEINENAPGITRNLFETSVDVIYEKNENFLTFEKKILDENCTQLNSFSKCDSTDNFKDSLDESQHSSLSGKENVINDEHNENKSVPANTADISSLVVSEVSRSLMPPIFENCASDSVKIVCNTATCNSNIVNHTIDEKCTLKKEVDIGNNCCTKCVSQDKYDCKPHANSNDVLCFDNHGSLSSNHELGMKNNIKSEKVQCYDEKISNQDYSKQKSMQDTDPNTAASVCGNADLNGNSSDTNLPQISNKTNIIEDYDDRDYFNQSNNNTKRSARKCKYFNDGKSSLELCDQIWYTKSNDTIYIEDEDFESPSKVYMNAVLNNKTNQDQITDTQTFHVTEDICDLKPNVNSNDTIYIDDDDDDDVNHHLCASSNVNLNEIANNEVINCDQLIHASKFVVSEPSQQTYSHKSCINSNDTIIIEDEDSFNVSQVIKKEISNDKKKDEQLTNMQNFACASEPQDVCDQKPHLNSNDTVFIDDNEDCSYSSSNIKPHGNSNNTIIIDHDDCIYPSSEFNINEILKIKEEKVIEGKDSIFLTGEILNSMSNHTELTERCAKSPSKSYHNPRFVEEFSKGDLCRSNFENASQPSRLATQSNNLENVPGTDCRIVINDQSFNYANDDIETLHKKLTSDLNLKLQVQLKIGNVQCQIAASAIELKPVESEECAVDSKSDLIKECKYENIKTSVKHCIPREISSPQKLDKKLASRRKSDDSKKFQNNSSANKTYLVHALDLHDTSLSFRESTRIQSKDSIIPLNLCTRENYFEMSNLRTESKENIPACKTPFDVLQRKVIASNNKYKNQYTFKQNKISPSKMFSAKTPTSENKQPSYLKKSSGTKIPIRKADNDVTPSKRTPKAGVKNVSSPLKYNIPAVKSVRKCSPSDKMPSELITHNKTPHYCIPHSNSSSKLPKSAQMLSSKKYQNIESPVAKYIRNAKTPKNIRPFTGRPLNFNSPNPYVESAVHESAVTPKVHPEWKRNKK